MKKIVRIFAFLCAMLLVGCAAVDTPASTTEGTPQPAPDRSERSIGQTTTQNDSPLTMYGYSTPDSYDRLEQLMAQPNIVIARATPTEVIQESEIGIHFKMIVEESTGELTEFQLVQAKTETLMQIDQEVVLVMLPIYDGNSFQIAGGNDGILYMNDGLVEGKFLADLFEDAPEDLEVNCETVYDLLAERMEQK